MLSFSMSPTTQPTCSNCGHYPDSRTDYCPDCGSEDPWVEESVYEFDPEEDLPVIISHYVMRDDAPLYKAFCDELFGEQRIIQPDEIDGPVGDLPRMGELHEELFYIITTDFEIEGPYYSESDAVQSEFY